MIQAMWRRRREIAYRVLNATLLACIARLYRWHDLKGAFVLKSDCIAYEHKGVLLVFDPVGRSVAGNIDVSGAYEELTVQRLLSVCSDTDVFYDVGAHEGVYALVVRQRNPGVRIVAIEPLAERLRRNLELNQVTDVCVVEAALGDRLHEAAMTTNRRASNHICARGQRMVKVETIDHLVADGLPAPTILKLDIKGYEFPALLGAEQTIAVHRPVILLEINRSLLRFLDCADPIVHLLSKHGYTLYAQTTTGLVEVLTSGSIPESLEDNFWAIPGGHPSADGLRGERA